MSRPSTGSATASCPRRKSPRLVPIHTVSPSAARAVAYRSSGRPTKDISGSRPSPARLQPMKSTIPLDTAAPKLSAMATSITALPEMEGTVFWPYCASAIYGPDAPDSSPALSATSRSPL